MMACPNCGCMERDHRGILTCRCPYYPITNKTLRRDCVKNGKCPECGGELDTGWECNKCNYDAQPIVADLPPDWPCA